MRIAIVGAGKMGAAVAEQAARAGHEVGARIGGSANRKQEALTAERLAGTDVAIEFSRPDAVIPNLMRLLDLGIPVVTGTTGWYDQLPAVETAVRERGGSLLYGPNFSVGAALFQHTAAALAARIASRPELDAAIAETHHRAKRDAPSGTALSLQQAVRAVDPSREYPIVSTRLGSIPGTHRLLVDGPFESIELLHTVRDRSVFAQGAVLAAEWLAGRTGFFHFHDILGGGSR
jgi:4-hydroxy-tetrahydrodipicolinate reductase